MIRHVLLFSFRPEVNERRREELLEGLRALPRLFPEMRGFELGRNESRRDATFDYGMTLTFDSSEALYRYLDSERHEDFVSQRFRPVISSRAIVTFAV